MRPKITRQMPIGELVMNYPESVEVLFARGFHCIGCGLSAYETLEQGAAAHGYDDTGIDELVSELFKAAKKAEAAGLERKCESVSGGKGEKTAREKQTEKMQKNASGRLKKGKAKSRAA
jgi:hybrid cluster-associated redox disulfide protein